MRKGLAAILCLAAGSARAAVGGNPPTGVAPVELAPVPAPTPLNLGRLKEMRDPFKQLTTEIVTERKPEIETIPVDQLHLVGVITGPSRTRAILRGPSGKIYVVYRGQAIGTRNGHIKRISEDEVVVNEAIIDLAGDRENVVTELKLLSEKDALAAQQSSQTAANDVVVHDSAGVPGTPGTGAPGTGGLSNSTSAGQQGSANAPSAGAAVVPASAPVAPAPPAAPPAAVAPPVVYPTNGGSLPQGLTGSTLINPLSRPTSQ